MNKRIVFLLAGFSLLTFTLQAQHDHTTSDSKVMHARSATIDNADKQFKVQLTEVYKSSQHVKEALVAGDAKKAQEAAGAVKRALAQVDINLLKDKAHAEWLNYQKAIKNSLDKIERGDKIKSQRTYFAQLSEALYQSVKNFGIAGGEMYYQFCPMALDGQGAYWLSDTRQIRNPYLGDKMLTCGATKETLK